jgi:hypothetical protein
MRELQLEDARILSLSRAGDMAVLFGPPSISRAFGVRTLARIPWQLAPAATCSPAS